MAPGKLRHSAAHRGKVVVLAQRRQARLDQVTARLRGGFGPLLTKSPGQTMSQSEFQRIVDEVQAKARVSIAELKSGIYESKVKAFQLSVGDHPIY